MASSCLSGLGLGETLDAEVKNRLDHHFLIEVKLAGEMSERQRIAIIGNILHVYDQNWLVPSMPVIVGCPGKLQALASHVGGGLLVPDADVDWMDKSHLAQMRSWLNRVGVGYLLPKGVRLTDSKRFGHLVLALMDKTEQQHGGKLNAVVRQIMQKQKKTQVRLSSRGISQEFTKGRLGSPSPVASKIKAESKGSPILMGGKKGKTVTIVDQRRGEEENADEDIEDLSSKAPPMASEQLARTPVKGRKITGHKNVEPVPASAASKERIDRSVIKGGGEGKNQPLERQKVAKKIAKKVTIAEKEQSSADLVEDLSSKAPPMTSRDLARTPMKPPKIGAILPEDDAEKEGKREARLKLDFQMVSDSTPGNEDLKEKLRASNKDLDNSPSTKDNQKNHSSQDKLESSTGGRDFSGGSSPPLPPISLASSMVEAETRHSFKKPAEVTKHVDVIPAGAQIPRTPDNVLGGVGATDEIKLPKGKYMEAIPRSKDYFSGGAKRGEKRKNSEEAQPSPVWDVFCEQAYVEAGKNEEELTTDGMCSTFTVDKDNAGPSSPTKQMKIAVSDGCLSATSPLKCMTKDRVHGPPNRRPPSRPQQAVDGDLPPPPSPLCDSHFKRPPEVTAPAGILHVIPAGAQIPRTPFEEEEEAKLQINNQQAVVDDDLPPSPLSLLRSLTKNRARTPARRLPSRKLLIAAANKQAKPIANDENEPLGSEGAELLRCLTKNRAPVPKRAPPTRGKSASSDRCLQPVDNLGNESPVRVPYKRRGKAVAFKSSPEKRTKITKALVTLTRSTRSGTGENSVTKDPTGQAPEVGASKASASGRLKKNQEIADRAEEKEVHEDEAELPPKSSVRSRKKLTEDDFKLAEVSAVETVVPMPQRRGRRPKAKQDEAATAKERDSVLNETLRDDIPLLKLSYDAQLKLKDDIYLTPRARNSRAAVGATGVADRRLDVAKLTKVVADEVYQTPTAKKGGEKRATHRKDPSVVSKAPVEFVGDDVYKTPLRRSARNMKQ